MNICINEWMKLEDVMLLLINFVMLVKLFYFFIYNYLLIKWGDYMRLYIRVFYVLIFLILYDNLCDIILFW